MYVVCWMPRTNHWFQNSVKYLCCTCWYAKLSKTVWIIHCFYLVNYYVIINHFLDQCYFLCLVTSYIGWEIKFAFKWNLNFILLQVIIIRGSWCKSLIVVLKNKFHYFCLNVWYHSKVNKTLLIILIKSSNFVQSCSSGRHAMETSLTVILNDTISCTSSFLFLVIGVSSDHQIVTECLLFEKVKK